MIYPLNPQRPRLSRESMLVCARAMRGAIPRLSKRGLMTQAEHMQRRAEQLEARAKELDEHTAV